MRKKQLENIISYLESLKDIKGEYKKYVESIDLLANRLLDYYTPDINGKYKNITKDEYEELDNYFKDAIDKSNKYLNSSFDDEKNEEARNLKKRINEQLHEEFLSKYYVDFKNVNIESENTFFDEMEKVGSKRVGSISNSNIYTEGFFQKDKLTVDYDNEKVSGTFIYKTDYDADKAIDSLIKEYSQKYPQYKEYFIALNDMDRLKELSNIKNEEIVKNNQVINFFNNKELKVKEIPHFDEYKNELEFLNANASFITKIRSVVEEINTYSIDLNLKKGTNLDKRNVAFFTIAKALDHKEVTAEARSVSIEKTIDGKTVYQEGTFIEDVKGKMINEFDIKDEVHTLSIDSWDTVEAKKSLANLQIMDYICGNKRSMNDIKFEFDPNTHKLVGVKGVNNEKSFFTPKEFKSLNKEDEVDYSDIKNLKVIDEDMATKISSLEEATFKAFLVGNGLNKNEVRAAWERVEKLQELVKKLNVIEDKEDINEKLKDSDLVIVSNEAWKNLSLKALANNDKTNENIFDKTLNAQAKLTNEIKIDKNLEANYKILKFSYDNKLLQGDKFLAKARKNAPLFGTSRRYTNILKGLSEYNAAITTEEKEAKLAKLKDYVKVYNTEKVAARVMDENGNLLKNLTGKDLERVNLVKDINQFIDVAEKMKVEVADSKKLMDDDIEKVDEFNQTYRLGKYKAYAKAYKNEDGKIKIRQDVIEREKQNNASLSNTSKKLISLNNDNNLDKDKNKKEQYLNMQKYLDTSIESYKKQLKTDYEHGVIPKEYYDYKIDKYDKKIFDLDDEKMFVAENPASEIFVNEFHEQINNDLKFGEIIDKDDAIEENIIDNKLENDNKEIEVLDLNESKLD